MSGVAFSLVTFFWRDTKESDLLPATPANGQWLGENLHYYNQPFDKLRANGVEANTSITRQTKGERS